MLLHLHRSSLMSCWSLVKHAVAWGGASAFALALTLMLHGCGGDAASPATTSGPAGETATASALTTETTAAPSPGAPAPGAPQPGAPVNAPSPGPLALPKISLSGNSSSGTNTTGTGTETLTPATSKTSSKAAVLAALQPLQILRDNWQVIQQKEAGTSDALQHQEWIWDFKTDRNQPAIVMDSPAGKHIRSARVTFDPATEKYLMVAITPEGETRQLEGEFSEPVQDLQGGDNKPQRTYKLLFTQVAPEATKDSWQILLNQRENNRYLMELSKKRGSSYLRFDTLGAQRMGTSFALSDTDYGDRTCVVSGGLGTAAVTFEGKTFYVCCSGCRSAFDEEPKTWIADYEAKMKK